jgi:hypothetical protein
MKTKSRDQLPVCNFFGEQKTTGLLRPRFGHADLLDGIKYIGTRKTEEFHLRPRDAIAVPLRHCLGSHLAQGSGFGRSAQALNYFGSVHVSLKLTLDES